MDTIRHRVGIQAPRPEIIEKLTTLAGLGSWWTHDVSGDPGLGGKVEFLFGGPDRGLVAEVTEIADDRVVWRVVSGPDEWMAGPITFALEDNGDETVLKFTHSWREPVEFMFHCSTKWAYFLLSLKASLEDGKGTPFPEDLHISTWG